MSGSSGDEAGWKAGELEGQAVDVVMFGGLLVFWFLIDSVVFESVFEKKIWQEIWMLYNASAQQDGNEVLVL